MATVKPHLFTLPREIRDQIYSYLHEERNFQWGDWKRTETFRHGLSATVHATESDPSYSISYVS
jgi:hypothetical protein